MRLSLFQAIQKHAYKDYAGVMSAAAPCQDGHVDTGGLQGLKIVMLIEESSGVCKPVP